MSKPDPILFFNRYTNQDEVELVAGDTLIRWLYETKPGQRVVGALTGPLISRLYGYYQNSPWSARDTVRFRRQFKIKMKEYETGPFKSFNDFFIRRFKPGSRKFEDSPDVMPAFCEGRYLGFEKITADTQYPVKGQFLQAQAILENKKLSDDFLGGPMLIARLCPVDYHRFHFPDDGKTLEHYRVEGRLHSVNPLALKFRGDIFSTNERQVSILKTSHLGKIAYVEVGALCVGKIVQTHARGLAFKRGDEKGYFLFGASTVIVMGEPGAWVPDKDILQNSMEGRETFIKLGDHVAKKRNKN